MLDYEWVTLDALRDISAVRGQPRDNGPHPPQARRAPPPQLETTLECLLHDTGFSALLDTLSCAAVAAHTAQRGQAVQLYPREYADSNMVLLG